MYSFATNIVSLWPFASLHSGKGKGQRKIRIDWIDSRSRSISEPESVAAMTKSFLFQNRKNRNLVSLATASTTRMLLLVKFLKTIYSPFSAKDRLTIIVAWYGSQSSPDDMWITGVMPIDINISYEIYQSRRCGKVLFMSCFYCLYFRKALIFFYFFL